MRDPPELRTSGRAGDPSPVHEQLDRTATDDETLAQDEFGMDAPSPVGGPALEVDSADQLGEECVPMDLELGFQLADPPLRRGQLVAFD